MTFKLTYPSKKRAILAIASFAVRLVLWGLVTCYWFIPAIIADTSNGWIVFWYFIYIIIILTGKWTLRDKHICSKCHQTLYHERN